MTKLHDLVDDPENQLELRQILLAYKNWASEQDLRLKSQNHSSDPDTPGYNHKRITLAQNLLRELPQPNNG